MGSKLLDKKFLSHMIPLASPIILQQFIFSSLGMVDSMMIGQLGETAVAAVGVANQVFFLATLLFFGITSGSAIFTAQYWGQKDIQRIQKILGLSLVMSMIGGLIFSLVAILYPEWVIGIYTRDPEAIVLGADYLQIVAFGYLFSAITYSYSAVLRSIENVKIPTLVSLIALSLNSILNYGLIFGNFGLPAMGVSGAALATVIARIIETTILLIIIYRKKLPVAAKPANLLDFRGLDLGKYFRTTLPVIITEIVWSFGMTTYSVVYARIGTESIAAYNIAVSLDRLIFVVFIGLGNACAIMIGNQIGAGEIDTAKSYGKKFLIYGTIGSTILSVIMLLVMNPILSLYKVSPETLEYAQKILILMSCSLPIRSLNLIILIGILRSGGDTLYAFYIDAGVIWIVGVPLALLGGFIFHLPIYWVYLMVLADEIVKFVLGLTRFFSHRWIHTLTEPA